MTLTHFLAALAHVIRTATGGQGLVRNACRVWLVLAIVILLVSLALACYYAVEYFKTWFD